MTEYLACVAAANERTDLGHQQGSTRYPEITTKSSQYRISFWVAYEKLPLKKI